jgi:hypothetical protein
MAALQQKDVKLSVDWNAYMKENGIEQIEEGRYRVPLLVELPEGITKPAGEMVILVELTEK